MCNEDPFGDKGRQKENPQNTRSKKETLGIDDQLQKTTNILCKVANITEII